MEKSARGIGKALKMGLIWGLAWFGAGMVILIGFLLTTGSNQADVPFPLGFGAIGFFGGVIFSLLLEFLGSSPRFEQISLQRIAAWGAAAGLILSVGFVSLVAAVSEGPEFLENLIFLAPIFAAAGAACAGVSLAIARKTKRATF